MSMRELGCVRKLLRMHRRETQIGAFASYVDGIMLPSIISIIALQTVYPVKRLRRPMRCNTSKRNNQERSYFGFGSA